MMIGKKIYFPIIAVILVGAGIGTGVLIPSTTQVSQADYNELLEKYTMLYEDYLDLEESYALLVDDYETLSGQYDEISDDYYELELDYTNLLVAYDLLAQTFQNLCGWIYGMALPAQYMVFAEAVRRYYFYDYYLSLATDDSTYWYQYARFCRDIVLHDSQTTNNEDLWFSEISNVLADCFKYGTGTPYLAYNILYGVFDVWHWGETYWNPPLDYLDVYVQDCCDMFAYEYDTDITAGRFDNSLDYVKFPVETAFRTRGDCEDQAIFCATYLESCGYETALAIVHDANNPNFEGGLFHVSLLVHIEDTTSYNSLYSAGLWNLGGYDPYEEYTWCWLDTTWDTPFGTKPAWLQYYSDNGITWDELTIAFCDLNGDISL